MYIFPCLKGLFDTDGSIWVNRRGRSINVSFRSASFPLIKDFKEMCELIGIKPQPKLSRIKNNDIKGKKSFGYQLIISSKS